MANRTARKKALYWMAAVMLFAALGCGDDDSTAADAGDSGSGGTPAVDAGGDAGRGGGGGTTADASTPPDAGNGQPDASTGHDAGEHEGDEDGGGGGPSWADEVHPALVAGCGGCHGEPSDDDGGIVIGRPGGPGEGTGDAPGKFAVMDAHDAYEAVLPFAVPGSPEHSNLYIKISQDTPSTGGQRMPPALRQWDDPDIQLVRDWIAAGALEN